MTRCLIRQAHRRATRLVAAVLLAVAMTGAPARAAEELDAEGRPLLVGTSLGAPAPAAPAQPTALSGRDGTADAPPLRIGIVDLDRITRESARIRGRIGSIEGRLEGYSRDVESRTAEIERDRIDLARKRPLLAPEEVARRERRLRQLEEEVESIRFRARRLTARLESEVVEPSLREIVDLTRDHAREAGFDLVLRRDLVLFAAPRVDITGDVLRRLDDLGPAPALLIEEDAPAPAAAAAAPAAAGPISSARP